MRWESLLFYPSLVRDKTISECQKLRSRHSPAGPNAIEPHRGGTTDVLMQGDARYRVAIRRQQLAPDHDRVACAEMTPCGVHVPVPAHIVFAVRQA